MKYYSSRGLSRGLAFNGRRLTKSWIMTFRQLMRFQRVCPMLDADLHGFGRRVLQQSLAGAQNVMQYKPRLPKNNLACRPE
ncbi:hypothetical protein C7N43_25105 [Sphingobacteriales bacterium UPWRP_1]|nr:hypothetical protein BVG80_17220 [Sphingobacteriales bacterium TSM_CSM]PSJ74239.1 hypothetical protein C7N43_25105 [Sphingobacteriales bacterium UPWRP_1]